jgi:hypothetical protein
MLLLTLGEIIREEIQKAIFKSHPSTQSCKNQH